MTDSTEHRIAWVDATHGVAGDMLMGALIDAGASLGQIQADIERVCPDTVTLRTQTVVRAGMRATKVHVDLIEPDQHHRHWTEIDRLLAGAGLDGRIERDARFVFEQIARAESRCHGVPVGEVHFHEVGAWDSIADVVGVCSGLAQLGIDEIVVTDVALGSGRVQMAHGELEVPGPAVVELSAGWPTKAGFEGAGELTTPTGMALLRLGRHANAMPPMAVVAVGVGAGTKDFHDHPNTVRVVVGENSPSPLAQQERTVVECNVDDLDPRLWPGIVEALLTAGADDAWLTPIVMKKGRPAHTLSALADAGSLEAVREEIFARTSTLGVREYLVTRRVLERAWETVDVGGCDLRVKLGLRGGRVVHVQPEFDDVRSAAARLGRAELDVLAAAHAAAAAAGLVPGLQR